MNERFISIHLPLNPTDEHLRQAREVMSLIRSMSTATDKTRGDTDESASLAPPAPPAPSTAAAMPPAPPAPTIPPAPVEADSTGLLWDERIHSGGKVKNKDGTWKKRKGVQESMVKTVEAQIRATMPAAPVPVAAPPPPPATPNPAAVFQQTVAPPAPPPAPAPAGNPFVDLLTKVSGRITGGTLTQAKVAECCKQMGIVDAEGNGSLPQAAQRTDLLPALSALIDAS